MFLIGDRAAREKSKKYINEIIINIDYFLIYISFFDFSAARPIKTTSSGVLQQLCADLGPAFSWAP